MSTSVNLPEMEVKHTSRIVRETELSFEGYKSTRNFRIEAGAPTVKIPDIRIGDYRASYEVDKEAGKVYVNFGCKHHVESDFLAAIAQLTGEAVKMQGYWNNNKVRFVEGDLAEESENYYILKGGEALRKSDYTYGVKEVKVSVLKSNWGMLRYRDHSVCQDTPKGRESLVRRLRIVMAIKQYIEDYLKGELPAESYPVTTVED